MSLRSNLLLNKLVMAARGAAIHEAKCFDLDRRIESAHDG
jgi:hypothetical protein